MRFEEFLVKHDIILDKKINDICESGIYIMGESKDPHHAESHINRIFDELDNFLIYEETIDKNKLEMDVLLTSICWHDVWKSKQKQNTSIFKIIYDQIMDGRGSKRIFNKYIQDKGLSKDKAHKISYSILNHSPISYFFGFKKFFPLKTIESIVLKDIDELDAWSLIRFENLKESYLGKNKLTDEKLIRVAKWWVSNVMKNACPDYMCFDYSKQEFVKRKEKMIESIYGLWENREKYFDKSNPKVWDMANNFLER